jgi:chemotaxis methyl-accepting protein methylase
MDLTHVRFEGVADLRTGSPPARDRSCDREQPAPIATPAVFEARVASRDDFAGWVLERAGLVPHHFRADPLARRVPACLRALKVSSPVAARALIVSRPERLEIAVNALLNGTTEFFRDAAVFDALATAVLPALTLQKRPIRIWCAGCSSGPEVYSVAILLHEARLIQSTRLLASDCRQEAIDCARAAAYGTIESVPHLFRDRYFERAGHHYRPVAALRESISWVVRDITISIEPGPWDVILWRNAAIYLAPEVVARVTVELVHALAPGGYLVLGKAERATSGCTPVAPCIFQREGAA